MFKKSKALLSLTLAFFMLFNANAFSLAAEAPSLPAIALNEIETKDAADGPDWVEIHNPTDSPVDISGWYIVDNDLGHEKDAVPVAEGTILNPGEFYVFEGNTNFTFGLGKNDSVTLYNKNKEEVDKYTWGDLHAEGTWSRTPDGTGEWTDLEPTKGAKNQVKVTPSTIVVNEIESNGDNTDWVEILNVGSEAVDISGWFVTDDGELSRLQAETFPLAEGTILKPGEYFIFDENTHFTFGLGGTDKVVLYDKNQNIIDTHAWDGHAVNALGRIPNGTGDFIDIPSTRLAENVYVAPEIEEPAPVINPIAWPGSETIEVIDNEAMFLEDSSGLDYFDGHMYAVDNGTAIFWKLALDENGNPTKAPGFENGKKVVFQKDANNLDAKSPDSEGITVDANGYVYLAVERDNNAKGINFNNILMVDTNTSDERLIPMKEWDITALLPQVAANTGIETVEWIPNSVLAGKLFDLNTKAAYDPANYTAPAINDGLFLVGLEDNGHIYALRLNSDSTATLIAEIKTNVGGVMGLNYDDETGLLWALADDGFNNVLTTIALNGTNEPTLTHYNPPAQMDTTFNNEGFVILPSTYGPDCQRPVFWFMDGVTSQALRRGYLDTACAPVEEEPWNDIAIVSFEIPVKVEGYELSDNEINAKLVGYKNGDIDTFNIDGNFIIASLRYDKVGTYKLQMSQTDSKISNIVLDDKVIEITVSVEEADGKLVSKVEFSDENGFVNKLKEAEPKDNKNQNIKVTEKDSKSPATKEVKKSNKAPQTGDISMTNFVLMAAMAYMGLRVTKKNK